MAHAAYLGRYRSVYSGLFDHPDFQVLSSAARLTFLALRLGSENNIASIFRLHLDVLREQTGLRPKALKGALRELSRKPKNDAPWCEVDASLVWIRNGLHYDPTVSLDNPKHRKALLWIISQLPNRSSVVRKFKEYYDLGKDSLPARLPGTVQDRLQATVQHRDGGSRRSRSRSRSKKPPNYPKPLLPPVAGPIAVSEEPPAAPPPAGGSAGSSNGHEPAAILHDPFKALSTGEPPLRRPAPGEFAELRARLRLERPDTSDAEIDARALMLFRASLAP